VSAVVVRAQPADAAECARVLAEASRERRAVRIAGNMTKAYLGDARACDLELRTTRIAGIVDHVPADLTVTVAAGTRIADVVSALARFGQFLPLDPPHADDATVGGIVAANANGFWRSRYGGVRDLLIGTRVALTDGTVIRAGGRVVKNVAGYDLDKLFVGSLGTLGVIVEATFKVLPLPAATDGVIGRFSDAPRAFATAAALVRAASRPAALVVARGERGGWHLAIAARGDAHSVGRAMTDAEGESLARGGELAPLTNELTELRELPARAREGALVRVALPLATQPAFAEMAARTETFAMLVADAASGIHRIHLLGGDDAVATDAEALILAARVVGGNGRIERRSDQLRARLGAWPARPSGEAIMRRLKAAFDPAGILEPGRSAVA
jgi:glycolate oxidase FAD binding subunit